MNFKNIISTLSTVVTIGSWIGVYLALNITKVNYLGRFRQYTTEAMCCGISQSEYSFYEERLSEIGLGNGRPPSFNETGPSDDVFTEASIHWRNDIVNIIDNLNKQASNNLLLLAITTACVSTVCICSIFIIFNKMYLRPILHSGHTQYIKDNLHGMLYTFELNNTTGKYGFTYVSDGYSTLYSGLEHKHCMYNLHSNEDDKLNLKNRLHPEDRGSFNNKLTTSATELTPFLFEGRKMYNREWIWIRASSKPKKIGMDIIQWNGYMENISIEIEQKKEYTNLVRVDEHFTNNLTGVLYTIHFDLIKYEWKFTYVSDRYKSVFGDMPEKQTLYEKIYPTKEQLQDADCEFDVTMHKYFIKNMESFSCNVCKRVNNKFIWLRISSDPKRIDEHTVVWTGYMEHITKEIKTQKIRDASTQLILMMNHSLFYMNS